MKKKLAVLISTLLTLSMLAGCGKESDILQEVKVEKYIEFSSPYTGLDLTITPKAEVTDEMVEETALSAYLYQATQMAGAMDGLGVTDRAVALGDTVNIDYSGKEDGVAFEGGTATGQSLGIGSGSFIDGFEEGLIGVMPGETVDLNLKFPDTYHNPDMAGVEVVFTVTVNYIYPSSVEEMQDAVIETFTAGEFTTVTDYLEFCREFLEFSADNQYTVNKENVVIGALEAIVVCDGAPEELVNRYATNVRKSLEEEAATAGVDLETLCTYYYQTDSETYINSMAQASAEQAMMFQYIANAEGLNVSDEELETSLQEFAAENNVASVDILLQETEREEFREYFMFEKVVEFIVANANVTEG